MTSWSSPASAVGDSFSLTVISALVESVAEPLSVTSSVTVVVPTANVLVNVSAVPSVAEVPVVDHA